MMVIRCLTSSDIEPLSRRNTGGGANAKHSILVSDGMLYFDLSSNNCSAINTDTPAPNECPEKDVIKELCN